MAKKYSAEWWKELRPERIGTETEGLVRSVLDQMNKWQGFTYHRMPDAKAARGSLAAQPGDFLYASNLEVGNYSGFLEVKATKHAYRLGRDKVSQLPKLKLFGMAGCGSFVLVHHYLHGVWRIVAVSDLEDGAASWDLSGYPSFTSPEAAMGTCHAFHQFIGNLPGADK